MKSCRPATRITALILHVDSRTNNGRVSTEGTEYTCLVNVPPRGPAVKSMYGGAGGGLRGYYIELDLDGKSIGYVLWGNRNEGFEFMGFATDKTITNFRTFKFADTVIKAPGEGGGAGAGAGAGAKVGTIEARIFHAVRGGAYDMHSASFGNHNGDEKSVKKGAKFFMNPSLSTKKGTSVSNGNGVAKWRWNKESTFPVATLRVSYETAETLQLRGAKVNMAAFFDADDDAGGAGAGAGAAEVKPEPIQWAQPKSVRRAEKKRKAEEAAAAARKKAKKAEAAAAAVKAEKQEPGDDYDAGDSDSDGVIDLTA